VDDVNWTALLSVLGAAVIAPIATVSAAWLAGRGKRAEEERLLVSTRAEVDARLLETFVTLMARANARGQGYVAETALCEAIRAGSVDVTTPEALHSAIKAASINLPVGSWEQDAAVAAVAELGARYPLLWQAALEGLEGVASVKAEVAERALSRLATAGGDPPQPVKRR
jgi:hypothetical protein